MDIIRQVGPGTRYMDASCTKNQDAGVSDQSFQRASYKCVERYDMPADAVDFTSLANFQKSIMRIDTAHQKCFP